MVKRSLVQLFMFGKEIMFRKKNHIIYIIVIGLLVWAAAFIYRSSFIAIDGKRYYCLFDDAMILSTSHF